MIFMVCIDMEIIKEKEKHFVATSKTMCHYFDQKMFLLNFYLKNVVIFDIIHF